MPTLLKLSGGKYSLVDEDSYPSVSRFKWHTLNDGNETYAVRLVTMNGKRTPVMLHNQISGNSFTDHINGCGLDNRKCNLRNATPSLNQANKRKHKATSSKYKGVAWYKNYGCWRASICKNRCTIHLGYFASEADAGRAYDKKAKELFGEYARLNDIPVEVW